MKLKNKRLFVSLLLLPSLFWQTITINAQQTAQQITFNQDLSHPDHNQIFKDLLRQGRGNEFSDLLENIFGDETGAAGDVFNENSEQLFQAVTSSANRKAEENLEKQITERKAKPNTKLLIAPSVKPKPGRLPVKKGASKSKKLSFDNQSKLDWRRFAFGFQPLLRQDEKPDIKMTETDSEIKAEGSDKKSFETKDAKGTRTQKVETKYLKDGKTFGVEIKDTQIIEAVSKPDGKSFRQELVLLWGADVAACPDANGVSSGTGKAKVVSKTTYTENGETVVMTSEFDLQAKLAGYVNDRADMTHYDLQLNAYMTNSGYEEALRRNIIKEIKIKDGKYGLHYDISGNTIEVSDGKYGGYRRPAKIGEAEARKLTPMSDAEGELIGSAIGRMIPSIWHSANEMYKSAQKNWKNYGCVEIVCQVPKTFLKQGEEIVISSETVHLQDSGKINAQFTAEAYEGQITPETQAGKPGATFTFTQTGEGNSSFHVESVSKRGIGRGDVEFQTEKETEEGAEPGSEQFRQKDNSVRKEKNVLALIWRKTAAILKRTRMFSLN